MAWLVQTGSGSISGSVMGRLGSRVSGNNIFYQIPKSSTRSSETHSGLVVSKQKLSDITLDINMESYKQLRQNSPPNAWEAA
jgi:hypothetical protein